MDFSEHEDPVELALGVSELSICRCGYCYGPVLRFCVHEASSVSTEVAKSGFHLQPLV